MEEIIEKIYPAEESIVCKLGYDKISMFDTYKAILDMDILKYHDDGLVVRITGEKKMLHVLISIRLKENKKWETQFGKNSIKQS